MAHQSNGANSAIEAEDETSPDYPESDDDYNYGAKSMYHAARSDADTIESTRSLYDSDFDYVYLNDRKFIGEYYLPIDEQETNRWWMLHYIYNELLNNSSTTVPLDNPQRILDVGCGRGDWAADMGSQYPSTEVIGSDIAPLQLKTAPANVYWEIDDAEIEEGWSYTTPFDFIHFRGMKGAFKDWSHIYAEAYKHLEPGGWIEVLDYDNYEDLLSRFKGRPEFMEWYLALTDAIAKSPRPFNADHLEPHMLEQQGFEDVSVESFDKPIGGWGKTKREKVDGMVFLKLQMGAVEPLCLRTLHEYGGWSLERINELCMKASEIIERVANDPELVEGSVFRVKVLKGRKPLPATGARRSGSLIHGSDGDDNDGESVVTITRESTANGSSTA